MKMKGLQLFKASFALIECFSTFISYAGSVFFLEASRTVTNKEQTLPTTTASSAPTK